MELKRPYAACGLITGAILMLSGCNGTGTSAAISTSAATGASTAAENTSPATVAASPAAPGSNQSSGGGSGSTGGQCLTSGLSVTATAVAGRSEAQVDVTFTNKGGSSCSLYGYPGVDLQTNVGANPVQRKSGASRTKVTLAPGQHTVAVIEYPVNNSGGTGIGVTSMVVTPPSETHSVTIPWPGGSLPVTDGSDPRPMDVSPVGSAG
jgi:hypothetical protein